MKKTIMVVFVIAFMAIGVQSLQAEDVIWYVGSDVNSCSTYFFAGSHTGTVVITRTRVDNNLNPIDVETDFVTFASNQHYVINSSCPNRRYIYRIYYDVGGVRTLASNKAYILRAADNVGGPIACSACPEG